MELSNKQELSNKHRRFLLLDQGIFGIIPNLIINILITWLLNRSQSVIPLWGPKSIAFDLIATAFIMPVIICLIVSPLIFGKVWSGKMPPILPEQLPHWRWYRRSRLVRGMLIGVFTVVFGAVPLVWALTLGEAQPFSLDSFVWFKAVWSTMLALLITPKIAWWALANASRKIHTSSSKLRERAF